MHPQLQAVADDLEAARRRLHELARRAPAEAWGRRPDPQRWSMGECVAHLNLTSKAFEPLVEAALAEGRMMARVDQGRYRRNFTGWLLWRMTGPAPRQRVKTTAAFIPAGRQPVADLLAEFDAWHVRQLEYTRAADGLPLEKLRIVSPFSARVKYNLYACLTILPRHEHRHLWQAEQVWAALQSKRAEPGSSGQT